MRGSLNELEEVEESAELIEQISEVRDKCRGCTRPTCHGAAFVANNRVSNVVIGFALCFPNGCFGQFLNQPPNNNIVGTNVYRMWI